MRLGLLAAVLLASACSGTDPYVEFRQRLDAGGTCPDLFAFRNSLDPNSPAIDAINADLQEVGCYSSTSTRQAQPTATSPEGTADAPPSSPAAPSFTVQEYRVYRAIIDTPMSVSEAESVARAARQFDMTEQDVTETVDKVQRILAANRWYGTAESEIRRASDWKE